jgi:endonuclease III-like uncharacterized protein
MQDAAAGVAWFAGGIHYWAQSSILPLARVGSGVYREMHSFIVGVGESYCRKSQAQCDECPLQKFLLRSK